MMVAARLLVSLVSSLSVFETAGISDALSSVFSTIGVSAGVSCITLFTGSVVSVETSGAGILNLHISK